MLCVQTVPDYELRPPEEHLCWGAVQGSPTRGKYDLRVALTEPGCKQLFASGQHLAYLCGLTLRMLTWELVSRDAFTPD